MNSSISRPLLPNLASFRLTPQGVAHSAVLATIVLYDMIGN